MKRKATDSVNLIEMVVCIAFFAISCAIIFQMLTTGVIRSVESDDLTWASIEAQSMAETVKKLPALTGFNYSNDSENKINKTLTFDRDKQPITDGSDVYKIILDGTIKNNKYGDLLNYEVLVKKQDKEIYKISSSYYFKGGI